ncbi:MAG: hypothetical protein GF332_03190 [Candidatus Moranbacteria bacterium]|nr:hypothetical protein [Candidatus Moranbacteria bacterium]
MNKKKRKKVLVAELTSPEAFEIFKKNKVDYDVKYKTGRREMLKIIKDYNAILVRSETLIDKEFLDAAKNLQVVGRGGSGTDNIDIQYAQKKGIVVANTPRANIITAAEHTIGLMICACRNISWADSFIKSGDWDRKRFKGFEIYGKTIGIIGLGKIGGLVAKRMINFGVKLIAYDPYVSDQRFEKYKAQKKETLKDLIREADIITIHTPRTSETVNMISHKQINMMKDGVILLNVARGGLYNEKALVKGLRSSKIAAVGLDVWDKEPQSFHELYKFKNFVGTPHLGASTYEAQKRVAVQVAQQVVDVFNKKLPKYALNKIKGLKE